VCDARSVASFAVVIVVEVYDQSSFLWVGCIASCGGPVDTMMMMPPPRYASFHRGDDDLLRTSEHDDPHRSRHCAARSIPRCMLRRSK